MNYLFLAIAIISEVIATSTLKASQNFSRLMPSLIVLVGYGVAFFFLSLTLRTIPVGIAYAIWSGAGIILVSLVSYFLYRQRLDAWALIGIVFIVAGIVIINAFSKSIIH
jgi:small multidrug resistance pump